MPKSILQRFPLRPLAGPAIALLLAGQFAVAATTDLADMPLASSSSAQVKPNIFFILDDSGSMGSLFMPDGLSASTVGYRNASCNYVYYNPNVIYKVPPTSTGTDVNGTAQTAFTSAYDDGFSGTVNTATSNSGTTDLSSSFQSNGNDTAQAAYYWTYLGSTTLTPAAGDCNKSLSSSSDSTTREICTDNSRQTTTCAAVSKTALWRKVIVSSTSGPATVDINGDGTVNSSDADERQNFANWYSYYRTRLQMMKAAGARSFGNLTDSYRVGFMTICPGTWGCNSNSTGAASGSSVSAAKFLKIDDFNTTHRADWYSELFAQTTNSYTPLRTALSAAGRYYAGKNDGINKGMIPTQADDPIEYSCQQNFTILVTDGYWNSGSGKQLNGTSEIGNQDGIISELDAYNPSGSQINVSPRPIYDGATTTYVWNTASNQYQYASCSYPQDQQRTGQTFASTSQINGTTQTTTDATANIIVTAASTSGDTVTAVTINGANRLSGTITVSGNSNSNRKNSVVSGLANNLTRNGFSVVAYGTCTGAGNPSGCTSSSDRYATVKAPLGSGNVNWAVTFTKSASISMSAANFSGGVVGTTTNGPTPGASCSAGTVVAGGVTTVTTCNTVTTGPTLVNSCSAQSASAGNSYTATTCTTNYTPWANVATGSCAAAAASDANGHTATYCQTITATNGQKIQYRSTTTATTYAGPNQTGSVLSTTTATSAWTDLTGTCYPSNPPALPANGVVTTAGPPTPPTGCATWPCETDSSTGGSSNSLADVAQYYYKTDLRSASTNCTGSLGTGVDVCANNVPSNGTGAEDDRANWQHMTTFTMGLGLSGQVAYSPTYKTDSSGAFQNIRTGATNWPVPAADSATAIDDLWHAAVDGRGQYFSATDPDSVITSLQATLAGINARVASAAAAATSNLEPVAGDNFAYTAKYVTQKWTGDLEAHQIDLTSGIVQAPVIWSSQAKLDTATGSACDNRTIKLFRSGATNNLVNFSWNTYACDSTGAATGSADTGLNATEQGYFSATQIALLSQYPDMTTGQRTAAAGANLVNFIRGERGLEGFTAGDNTKLYRARDHVLGDIINSQPVYVKAPFADYADLGYQTFKTNNVGRTPMVFAAANDGMLHAFYAGTSTTDTQGGQEAWAFISSIVAPNLYKLATDNYATAHTYYMDGTPSVGDVFDTTTSADCALATPTQPQLCWKTILVGGLNKGGKGYYALDITNPTSPKGLWEFKLGTCYDQTSATTKAATSGADCHIGYTYNNPVIAKLADGTWAVFVTSGYNNDDGNGYLYVLNAATGQIIYQLGTGVGSATSPSGLNHIAAWADDAAHNNTAARVYGVDLLGNIWRFDVNDLIAPAGREATRLATLVDASSNPQPITTRPELAEVSGFPYVYVGTGRYLGTTDSSSTQQQTVWAIKDPLTSTAVTNLRSTLAQITMTNQGSGATAYRTSTCSAQCSSAPGWYADLPDTGERVNVDIKLQLGTLVVGSNVPLSNACNIGGYSWLNYFDYKTGVAPSGSLSANRLADSLVVGLNIVRLPDGKTVVIATTSDASQRTVDAPFNVSPPAGKRVSWREVVQ